MKRKDQLAYDTLALILDFAEVCRDYTQDPRFSEIVKRAADMRHRLWTHLEGK